MPKERPFSFEKAQDEAESIERIARRMRYSWKDSEPTTEDYRLAEEEIELRKDIWRPPLTPIEKLVAGVKKSDAEIEKESTASGLSGHGVPLEQQYVVHLEMEVEDLTRGIMHPNISLRDKPSLAKNEKKDALAGLDYDSFIKEYSKSNEKEKERLRSEFPQFFALSQFRDQVVVDLGCGDLGERTYLLMNVAEAKGYIGADIRKDAIENFRASLRDAEANKVVKDTCRENYGVTRRVAIPGSAVNADMLTTIKQLPANSVSIIMSGIDWSVMSERGDDEYMQEVSREIERVLNSNGALLEIKGVGSTLHAHEIGLVDVSPKSEKWLRGHFHLYKKQ